MRSVIRSLLQSSSVLGPSSSPRRSLSFPLSLAIRFSPLRNASTSSKKKPKELREENPFKADILQARAKFSQGDTREAFSLVKEMANLTGEPDHALLERLVDLGPFADIASAISASRASMTASKLWKDGYVLNIMRWNLAKLLFVSAKDKIQMAEAQKLVEEVKLTTVATGTSRELSESDDLFKIIPFDIVSNFNDLSILIEKEMSQRLLVPMISESIFQKQLQFLRDLIPKDSPMEPVLIPGKGRGLLATRAIKKGETVLLEKAFVSAPFKNVVVDTCAQTFYPTKMDLEGEALTRMEPKAIKDISEKMIESINIFPISCQKCGLTFSSQGAYDEAKKEWLDVLCKGDCGNDEGIKRLLPTTFVLDPPRPNKIILQSERDGHLTNMAVKFVARLAADPTLWDTVHPFLTYTELDPPRLMSDNESELLDLLHERLPHLKDRLTPRFFINLKSKIGINTFKIPAVRPKLVLGKSPFDSQLVPYPKDVGAALYVVGSLFNHSCKYNVSVAYSRIESNKIAWEAVRNIKQGEELTITYSPEKDMDRRRESLAHSYGFDCQGGCKACKKPLDENTKQKIATPVLL